MLQEQIVSAPEPRNLRLALIRGWRRQCPHCGAGSLFEGYLKVRESCDFCGEAFHHHRADDAPAWLTMIVVGHLIAPLMLLASEFITAPPWVHAVAWAVISMTLVIALLPRIKGVVIAFQWAHRMHGFDDGRP
ncbi:MAG: DUF983 domain-containing protein [Pseudomonadota bacterium]